MYMEQTATAIWDVPTTRIDGSPITGVLSYIIKIGEFTTSVDEARYVIEPLALGLTPGDHVFEVRTQEELGGVGRVSAPASTPFTLTERVAPNAPTGLVLSYG